MNDGSKRVYIQSAFSIADEAKRRQETLPLLRSGDFFKKIVVTAGSTKPHMDVELISDGLHIHPAVVRLTYRLFADRLVLISDSLRCAGMPDGDWNVRAVFLDGRQIVGAAF